MPEVRVSTRSQFILQSFRRSKGDIVTAERDTDWCVERDTKLLWEDILEETKGIEVKPIFDN